MYGKICNVDSHATLLDIFDADVERLKRRVGKDRAASTLSSMMQSRRYVSLFIHSRFETDDVSLQQLQPQFIHDFSVWLSAEQELKGGTIWLACQHLKGVVTRAHQRGLTPWNPFAGFHIAKNIRPREYLTEEELGRLINHVFKKRVLAYTRDVFVFSAFTGLSFVDMKELRHCDIAEVNGSKWIFAYRHKTKIPYQVKLLDIPLGILQKYDNAGKRIFEDMEYRTMAKRVHRVMEEVGIHKRISFHSIRHVEFSSCLKVSMLQDYRVA